MNTTWTDRIQPSPTCKRGTFFEREEDIDLETALAALNLESDTDLEENDVQEIPLAYKKPRQLRGEQRVSCEQEYGVCSDDISCQPNVDCEWEEWHLWNSWPSCNVMFTGGEEAKTSFFCLLRGRPQHVRLHWKRGD